MLDKRTLLERQTWWDNRDWEWYETRIPFFESPDPDLDATYYYRWEVVTKHLTYGSPETGYTFTEFIDRPFWSGTYGAISCPLGHQFYEVRWLNDRRIIDDFARYWFETSGAEPRRYSNWYGDAMWATYMVRGDSSFLRRMLPHMETQYAGWVDERFDPEHGMFRWVGAWDGMETNINSRQTDDEFGGAEGYRPTLNSYMFADALAIAKAARVFGDSAKAREYEQRAALLKARVQEELWDPRREFFHHQFAFDERDGIEAKTLTYETGRYAGNPHGRELIGYVPWQFNLPDPGYEVAWRFLMDPDYFMAPFGPSTVERHDPLFYVSPRCCVWSGNAWPYATTQTLVAMANLLNNYEQDVVTGEDYYRLLRIYARSHRLDGRPYIAEAADPDNGSWDGHNTFYHSEHYLHSGFVDLVITGVVGLRPRADDTLEVNPLAPSSWDYFALDDARYHGRTVAVVWDRAGDRYGVGSGLSVFVDGRKVASRPELGRLTVPIRSLSSTGEIDRPHNFAVNNGGAFYPFVSASSSDPETPAVYAADGNYWYHESPPNRWVTAEWDSTHAWIAVDFGITRPVEAIKLYFLDDGTLVVPPRDYRLEMWRDGTWVVIPRQQREPLVPTGRQANTVTFPAVETSAVRAVLSPRAATTSGLTELEAWGRLDLPLPEATAPVPDLAFNADGDGYPRVSASYTSPYDHVGQINDGIVAFTRYSRNRWTGYDSPNVRDWIEVEFGAAAQVDSLELFLWGDERGIGPPRDYAVQVWNGEAWLETVITERTPDRPTTWARNVLVLQPVTTGRLRVRFEHDLPLFAGVTELRVWGDDGVGGQR